MLLFSLSCPTVKDASLCFDCPFIFWNETSEQELSSSYRHFSTLDAVLRVFFSEQSAYLTFEHSSSCLGFRNI